MDVDVSGNAAQPVRFAAEYVRLTKQEYIQLKSDAKYWQSLHSRAVKRMEQQAERARKVLLRHKELAAQREAELRAELKLAQAKVRELQQRLCGRKSEQRKHSEALAQTEVQPEAQEPGESRPRRQRHGAPGHGRTLLPELAAHEELNEIESPQCPSCGQGLTDFPGTKGSEVVEIEVQAYRRVIRQRPATAKLDAASAAAGLGIKRAALQRSQGREQLRLCSPRLGASAPQARRLPVIRLQVGGDVGA